ncbi:hypothetical protein CP556_07875 [Natrinema sp. CBA1119]|nr:hypothetical protein CP556_07875 [Natrinema sp. CBA1119]
MLADELVDHRRFAVAFPRLGAFVPVVDSGFDVGLAGDGEFVDLLHGHVVGGADRNLALEEEFVGDLREAAVLEDDARIELREEFGCRPARAAGVPDVDSVPHKAG